MIKEGQAFEGEDCQKEGRKKESFITITIVFI
jgi:hypothetical protein